MQKHKEHKIIGKAMILHVRKMSEAIHLCTSPWLQTGHGLKRH